MSLKPDMSIFFSLLLLSDMKAKQSTWKTHIMRMGGFYVAFNPIFCYLIQYFVLLIRFTSGFICDDQVISCHIVHSTKCWSLHLN